MKTNKKHPIGRMLSLLLVLCMTVMCLPSVVFADEQVSGNGGAPVHVRVVDESVDNSSITVDLLVALHNVDTGEVIPNTLVDEISTTDVTVDTFDTVKEAMIEKGKVKLNDWLELMRRENPNVLFTVAGDMEVSGNPVSFDNRVYTMKNLDGSDDLIIGDMPSGTTSRYMLITGDYGKRGTYYVSMIVDVRLAAGSHIHTASDWKSDADNHWKVCTVCDTVIADSKAAHSYGGDNVCDVCGYTKSVTAPSYSIIEGANGTWTQNSDGTLTFRASGDFSKFTGVKVDGTLIDAKNYTAVSGSTVITLKSDYLKTLSAGKHTLTVVYTDGECSTNFEVKKAASEQTKPAKVNKATTPKTGNSGNLVLWFALLFVSGACVAGTTIYSRKKKYSAK